MKIAVYGASGRVGRKLVEIVQASSEDTLVAAFVSSESACLGQPVGSGNLVYQSLTEPLSNEFDLLIDFSNPAATLDLLGAVKQTGVLVIGTTGLSQEHEDKINQAAKSIPIMVGANFALGFEAFLQSGKELAALPQAGLALEEIYHARKKATPSGTSLRLAGELEAARKGAGISDQPPIEINVRREGDITGVHQMDLDLGDAMISLTYTVHGLNAYAVGALKAGRWLADRPVGRYTPADTLKND